MNTHKSKPNRLVAGRYEIRELIGRGGFSEVWLAYDRQLKRNVALKQLFGSAQNDSLRKQRDREIDIQSQLRSKHVIPLYDGFVDEGSYYLVLELMDYSLSRFEDPVALDKVLEWTKDCLCGLADIHESGVTHRDIKPGNIFLDHQGSIRIGDFGVAQSGDSASLPALSPKFIAPEIIVGDSSKVGPNSDLYSLGLVFYQLILGDKGVRKAFPEVYEGVDRPEGLNNRWLLWHNNLDRPAPVLSSLLPEIPTGISEWVLKLVVKDPSKRFQSAKEALAALPGSDARTPDSQTSTGSNPADQMVENGSESMSPSSWLKAVYALVFVAILSAGAYLLWPQRERPITTLEWEFPKTTLMSDPSRAEGVTIQWHGSKPQPDAAGLYVLREPLLPGRLSIRRDSFAVLDTHITLETGDSITLSIRPHLARLDSLLFHQAKILQDSERSLVTFTLNVEGTIAIEGVGEKQGDTVSFKLSHGKYSYAIIAPRHERVQGSVDLGESQTKQIDILLKTKRTKYPTQRPTSSRTPLTVPHEFFEFHLTDVAPTNDAGYVMVGHSMSKSAGSPSWDVSVNKFDKRGYGWERTFGGVEKDVAQSVLPTPDGGCVVAGYTHSMGAGDSDAWLIKVDDQGNLLWDHTYGGSSRDEVLSMSHTLDGQYMLAGLTWSKGAGKQDAWLIKTDRLGNLMWERTYGGANSDGAESVFSTPDGGYVVAGYSESKGSGYRDAWVFKTDSLGNAQWDQTYGGSNNDVATDVSPTSDDGYVLVGYTGPSSAKDRDAWIIKTDRVGNLIWERSYGGDFGDNFHCVYPTSDGGYVVAGQTSPTRLGMRDAWIIKTDVLGRKVWDWVYSSEIDNRAVWMSRMPNGKFLVAGNNWYKGAGRGSAWLFETDSLGRVTD